MRKFTLIFLEIDEVFKGLLNLCHGLARYCSTAGIRPNFADRHGAAGGCSTAVRGVLGSNPGLGMDVVFVRCWFLCLLCFLLLPFGTGIDFGKKSLVLEQKALY